jgi:PAS domain S-box-containing protein
MLSLVRDITEQVRAEQELREKEAEYRSVFEAGTDGLVINDLEDGHLVEVNPAMCKMHGYTYEEIMGLHPMTFIHPDSHSLFAEYLDTVKAGHVFHARATDVRKDVTEQVQAEEQLREKEAQYRSIFEKTTNGLAISDLEDGHTVEVNPAMCKMYGYTSEEFLALPPMATLHADSHHLIEESIQAIKKTGEFHTQAVVLHKDGTPFPIESHATTFMYQGKPHILSVVRDITEQVQAQQLLEQRVKERTRELSTLLEVSHNVASTIELKPLLGLILDQLQEVVHYGGAAIATLQDDEFTFLNYLGPLAQERITQMRSLFSQSAAHQQVLHSGEPLIIADILEASSLAQSLHEASREHLGKEAADYMHSWMGIPLKSKERVIGLLSLSHNEPNYFTPQHARMAMAIANQAAVAIENARLYEQAQALAALEERQRLARELHDSVSQALYGISLGAHTARTLLARDPSKVAEPLSYVLTQAETALTEMRALIFELRPESLETEGLVAALNRQAAALQARHGLEITTDLGDEPDLSLKVKQELYRFAQEALHNIVKHARANRVNVRMHWSVEGFLLEICDDGVGFDPGSAFPGHLGLHSMRERVTRLGGALQIESAPGEGTRIRFQLPV